MGWSVEEKRKNLLHYRKEETANTGYKIDTMIFLRKHLLPLEELFRITRVLSCIHYKYDLHLQKRGKHSAECQVVSERRMETNSKYPANTDIWPFYPTFY